MTDDVIARHVIVRGQVQGVFFRASCEQEARQAGVDGWVRNLSDGSVEAMFEGPAAAVQQLIDWCHTGPPRAAVEAVEVDECQPTGATGFSTR
ncbi:acylphosphatase [Aeromicrobium phragmitis]|uniref:Acylphosphatase n=1 Tax=Aeromicrobium phragmitis TaxID=2478914 RepID=A0A3L8PMU1_9ACTN|nr:acylphosphatase [Aeromicrobium phragmitis]RLV56621.1 acylphosphatase [Aeromicrobium phragmitis]